MTHDEIRELVSFHGNRTSLMKQRLSGVDMAFTDADYDYISYCPMIIEQLLDETEGIKQQQIELLREIRGQCISERLATDIINAKIKEIEDDQN